MKTSTPRTSNKSASLLEPAAAAPCVTSPASALSSHSPRPRPDVSHFDQLPDAALVAVKALAVVVGKGVSSVWRDIKSDVDFPKPIRLSAGCTRFRVGDIRAYLAKKAMATVQHKRTRAEKAG